MTVVFLFRFFVVFLEFSHWNISFFIDDAEQLSENGLRELSRK